MTNRGAFTLIELMVVVVILAVLVALLLPAVSLARSSAQSVSCLSNLRQVGMGFHAYSDDHHGQIAPSLVDYDPETLVVDGTDHLWASLIAPYIADAEDMNARRLGVIAACPTWLGRDDVPDAAKWSKPGYGKVDRLELPDSGTDMFKWTWAPQRKVFMWDTIPQASLRILAGDSTDWHLSARDFGGTPGFQVKGGNRMVRRGELSASGDPYRHGMRGNWLFCDLHVESLKHADAAQAILDPSKRQ